MSHEPLDAADLDDNDPCTVDACDPLEGVVHTQVLGDGCGESDECQQGTDDCSEVFEICVNEVTGWSCVDIDECALGIDDCADASENCENEIGAGWRCVDIDGCVGNSCSASGDTASTCLDVAAPGTGYSCACTAGYAAVSGTCEDFDACGADPCDVASTGAACVDEAPPSTGHRCVCPTWYLDDDGDGHGDASVSNTACFQPAGFVVSSADCDDGNPLRFPGNDEVCDAVDNNCDDGIDETGCPVGCSASIRAISGSTYVACSGAVVRSAAQATCEGLGDFRLVRIDNLSEHFHVRGLVDPAQPIWLGASIASAASQGTLAERRVHWVDNGTWDDGARVSYFDWLSSEPAGDGLCVHMLDYSSEGGAWGDDSCANAKPFVCEKKGVYESNGVAMIPDPGTASLTIPVGESGWTVDGLTVRVDITHTFIGDLIVSLRKNGNVVKVLSNRAGGSTDDIHGTFTITEAELGSTDPAGDWSLVVEDTALGDTGTLDYFLLNLHHP